MKFDLIKMKKGFGWKQALLVFTTALFALYIGAANLFLNSQQFRQLLSSWDEGILVFDWIVTPLPGVAYVSRPGVTHQDKKVRWTVKTDSAFIVFSPWSFVQRKVRFFQIRVGDTLFHFVERKHVDSKHQSGSLSRNYYPHIAFDKAPPRPSSNKTEAAKWSVHMSNVSIGALKDAWVNELHYTGSIKISGGFSIQPETFVRLDPARVRFAPGIFSLGEKTIADSLEGQIDYEMAPFHPDAPDREIISSINIRADLKAHARTLDPLNVYFASVPWLRLGDGGGTLRLNVEVDSGKLVAPGSVSFQTEDLTVQLGKFAAAGRASLHWVLQSGQTDSGIFDGKLSDAQIAYSNQKPFLSAATLAISGRSSDLHFADLFKSLSLDVSLSQARVKDLDSLNAFLPKQSPVRFQSGSATLALDLKTDSSKPSGDSGSILIDGDKSGVLLKRQALQGRLRVRLPFHSSRIAKGDLQFQGAEISFLDATLAASNGNPKTNWWAQVKVPQAQFSSDPTKVRADFQVLMRNSLPLVPLLTGVSRGETLLSQLVTVENIRCSGKFAVESWGFELTGLNFDSSSLKVQGFYTEKEDVAFARMLFVVNPFAVGLLVTQSQSRLILNDAFNWYKSSPGTAAEIAADPITK
jgi:hypothetical protein